MDSHYAHLKQHDLEWLERTLQDRVRHLEERQKSEDRHKVVSPNPKSQEQELRDEYRELHPIQRDNVSETRPPRAGPHDITAPDFHLHPDRAPLSKHIELIRQHDWAATGLGAMETWDTDLRRMVNMCLSDIKPTLLWWGPQRIAVYNEGYAGILANKHPAALGQTFHEIWPELSASNVFQTAFDLADRTGETSFDNRAIFMVERAEYVEEAWAAWSIIPIPGPDGNIGLYNSVIEITQQVLNDRRMSLLHRLEQRLSRAETVEDFWTQVLTGLDSDPHEVPFAALYGPASRAGASLSTNDVLDDTKSVSSAYSERASIFSETEWTLKGIISQVDESVSDPASLPASIDLDRGSSLLTPLFRDVMLSKTMTVLKVSDGTLPNTLRDAVKSRAFEGQALTHAVLLPIWTNYQEHRSGFLLLGLNARRRYDSDYERFMRLLHTQLTTTLASLVMAEDEARRHRVAARLAARDRIRLVEQLAESRHEVKQSELRFRSMADFAPIGIFELDTAGKLQYANELWIELTNSNSSLDRLHDFETFSNALVKDDRPIAWREWAKLQAGEQVRFECRLDRPFVTDEVFNGERMVGDFWILVAAYALRDDNPGPSSDQVKGVFGCLVDISRQKWIEGFQERQVRVQQERRRQQENFMDSTNHEARNPLAAITLCAEDIHSTMETLVHQSHAPQIPIARDTALSILENAEIVMSCAKHQKTIIDDVLTLSKLDSNMLTVSPEPVSPVTILDQALKMFRGEIQRNDVELLYTIDKSFFASKIDWVLLDKTRFLQILVNLLNNAVKFTQRAVSRKITVSLVARTSRPTDHDFGVRFAPVPEQSTPEEKASGNGAYLGVIITDTGMGMSHEELEHLFEKFRQASPKTYAQYGGSGLGLWICKELCAKLGGQIGVASSSASQSDGVGRDESGSTFAFYVRAEHCAPPTTTERRDTHQDEHTTQESKSESQAIVQRTDPEKVEAISSSEKEAGAPRSKQSDVAHQIVFSEPSADAHILIVEDNLVNQRVLQRQLARAGYRISVANHGKEALDLIYPPSEDSGAATPPPTPGTENGEVHVVLMDFEMPVMGGLECTRMIRQKEEEDSNGLEIDGSSQSRLHRRRPIVGVTANAREEQQKAAVEAGMNCVITKPFQMNQLLEAIASVHGENV